MSYFFIKNAVKQKGKFWQTFSIFLALPEDTTWYWSSCETHNNISTIYFHKIVAFVLTCIFQIFLINLEECWLVCSFLWYLFYFFVQMDNTGMFKNFTKCWQFYGIVKVITEKSTKTIGVFYYNFYWDIKALGCLFTSSFKISFSIFCWSTSIKLKTFFLPLHLFWAAILLSKLHH